MDKQFPVLLDDNKVLLDAINKAFSCAEYLRDFCRMYTYCKTCPFSFENECVISKIYNYPAMWDLHTCRL